MLPKETNVNHFVQTHSLAAAHPMAAVAKLAWSGPATIVSAGADATVRTWNVTLA